MAGSTPFCAEFSSAAALELWLCAVWTSVLGTKLIVLRVCGFVGHVDLGACLQVRVIDCEGRTQYLGQCFGDATGLSRQVVCYICSLGWCLGPAVTVAAHGRASTQIILATFWPRKRKQEMNAHHDAQTRVQSTATQENNAEQLCTVAYFLSTHKATGQLKIPVIATYNYYKRSYCILR